MNTIAVYFGCWNQAGHFLWEPGHISMRDCDAKRMRIPNAIVLDNPPGLFLPNKERKGTGCVTYLPGPNRTILAWWGSPWDSRPGVHAAFITNGDAGEAVAWNMFCRYFPTLSAQIERPSIVRDDQGSI